MEESREQQIIRLHHNLLKDEETPSKQADVRRKATSHFVKASCKISDNENTVVFLENKLKLYSNEAHIQENVYNDKLKALLSNSNNVDNNLKVDQSNLNEINPKQYLKPLSCANNRNFCPLTENFSNGEFEEFIANIRKISKSELNSSNSFHTVEITKTNPKKEESRLLNNKKTDESFTLSGFKTAREALNVQNAQKFGGQSNEDSSNSSKKRTLGNLGIRRKINQKFIPPIRSNSGSCDEKLPAAVDESLKNIDPKMVTLIKSEIMDCKTDLMWDDIAGLAFAKNAIQEAVVWPMLRPDIFTGLRRPPKGILLFGPPGTGKTLIGKCVASQSKSTFFSISASSLTSKWVGDGEKMVRALFAVARVHQPAVIFIDEVDSLLSQRSDTEHESSRRIKTEFLVQLDGATTDSDERLLVIGATNRPQELDEAARRRFVKRLYIPLPDYEARLQLVQKLICNESHGLKDEDIQRISSLSDGFSGADIKNLCSEASLGPIRSIDFNLIAHIQASDVRPLLMEDFEKAFNRVKSSVCPNDLEQYISWDKIYGSGF
ncbi:unnamed protein product [Phyllotreta striolata]|uniref:Fidgetin-like protein 1 n=1 Tax=Phyllotreta striolata TaxID=444603 RepID=A0A9N9TCT9_PHYSR|nr:unnamed protein product [Phyllotreta striolata]